MGVCLKIRRLTWKKKYEKLAATKKKKGVTIGFLKHVNNDCKREIGWLGRWGGNIKIKHQIPLKLLECSTLGKKTSRENQILS